MKIRKINGHEAAQVKVREYDDGSQQLVSYATVVVELDNEGWLKVNGLYSMTTIKHIGWYMRELGLTYQLAKHIYTHHMEYNIFTGEVIERA